MAATFAAEELGMLCSFMPKPFADRAGNGLPRCLCDHWCHGYLHRAQLEALYRDCARRFASDHPMAAAVIRWVAEDDLSHEQLAQLLQRSPGATREYVSQCRKKARVYFREWYVLATQRAAP